MDIRRSDSSYSLLKIHDDSDTVHAGLYWNRKEKYIWFFTLLFGTTALYASRMTMPLVAPMAATDLHWSKTEVGTVLSSFFWGYALTQIAGGYLSDRFGAERVILAAGIGWGLVTFWFHQIVYLFSDHTSAFRLILLSRIFLGACQGVHFPAIASISAKNINVKDRAFFFSFTTAGASVGTLLSGTLGSYINETFGWPYVFYTIGFISLLWVGMMKHYAMSTSRQRKPVLGMAASSPLSVATSPPDASVPWLVYLSAPSLWACMICHFCQNNCFFLLLSWLPTYFHDNFPEAQSWIFNIVPWILTIPGTITAAWLTQRMTTRNYPISYARKLSESLCMFTEIICLLVLGVTSSFTVAVLLTMVALFFKSFHSFGANVAPLDIAPKHSGFVHGIVNSVGSFAGFIGVYIAGYILEVSGSWAAVFNVTALINLVGIVIFLIFGNSTPIV